jgi:hypothetical protein
MKYMFGDINNHVKDEAIKIVTACKINMNLYDTRMMV